ncbi:hypothetical protein APR04_002547 [Promicromonospora umidemergens]|uniref:Uncharacterized protein n=1 Tax=Promicromonospora umidemergens TaxID=629679 RepID=A0ABP8WTU0_9MICO|nr:hypothetical protein [Promicromonospora umidemergens]MCP2283639.1 hypothetical protein [Promicromonospora umidemergens]
MQSAGTHVWQAWWGDNGPQPGDHWQMPHDFAEYAADQLDAEAARLRDRAEHLRSSGY